MTTMDPATPDPDFGVVIAALPAFVSRITLVALFSARRRGGDRLREGGLLHQARDCVREHRAAMLPMIDSIERKPQSLFAVSCNRVVEANALDEAPVASVTRIGHDDVEKRPLFGAAPSQSDDNHRQFRLNRKDFDYTTKKPQVTIETRDEQSRPA